MIINIIIKIKFLSLRFSKFYKLLPDLKEMKNRTKKNYFNNQIDNKIFKVVKLFKMEIK